MTSKLLRPMEFWPAAGWTCEECGRDNVARQIVRITPQTEPALAPNGEPLLLFNITYPQAVLRCVFCGSRFRLPEPLGCDPQNN